MLFFPTLSVLAGNTARYRIVLVSPGITVAGSIWVLMSLLTDLHAFYLEHQRCGELEAPDADPDWVVMTCTGGAQIARRIDDPSP